ncbi:flagellar export protein FliJ [Aliagarivorans marinus]|uniref:flagellar export protein FliJ n=1 Tax=Aliagarivorans marinus TaxID=561965 RepID=UPI000424BCDD|nr:flagellar export protein FliJ [Aliagarivorans marinus]
MARQALYLMVEQLQQKEQDAAKALAEVQQQLRQFEGQLQHLEEYRRSYLEQALAHGADGLKAQSFHQYQMFIQKLEQASVQQNQSIQQIRQNLSLCRKQWQEQRAKRRAMELLIEKQVAEKEKAQLKAEQKLLDEYALFAHFRNADPIN